MNKENNLKPCPFCGELPKIIDKTEVEFLANTMSLHTHAGKSIACVNLKCGIRPYTYPCPENSIWMFENNWNTRGAK